MTCEAFDEYSYDIAETDLNMAMGIKAALIRCLGEMGEFELAERFSGLNISGVL